MATSTLSETTSAPANYTAIRVDTLKAIDHIDCDLFFLDDNQTPTLYRERGYEISPDDLSKLKDKGITLLYVRRTDSSRVQERLRENIEALLVDDELPPSDRFGLLQSAMSVEIEQAFRMINVNSAVEKSTDIGHKLAKLLAGCETLPADIYRVARHDFYTFTHITNVGGYAVLLAERTGITDTRELESIAIGALLHDIGKRFIPPGILNKTGRLSEKEWDVIKAHPQRGYEELCGREELGFGQLMMVYQHHEKLDGSGYPVAAYGDDIHPWARLCTIVDIFDAMTCKRPYRRPLKLPAVLEHLSSLAGTHLDKEMVECWVSTMEPSGSSTRSS